MTKMKKVMKKKFYNLFQQWKKMKFVNIEKKTRKMKNKEKKY